MNDRTVYAIIAGLAVLTAASVALTQLIVGGDTTFAVGVVGSSLTLAGTLAGRGKGGKS